MPTKPDQQRDSSRTPRRPRAAGRRRPRVNLTDLPCVISMDEAAEILGISRSAAYRAAQRGELRTFWMNGKRQVPTAPLLRMLGR
jgi:excisionase family DNA binding protein